MNGLGGRHGFTAPKHDRNLDVRLFVTLVPFFEFLNLEETSRRVIPALDVEANPAQALLANLSEFLDSMPDFNMNHCVCNSGALETLTWTRIRATLAV